MLFKVAITLLILWVLGMTGILPGGELLHVLLLVGLMLFLLSVLRSRDQANARPSSPPKAPR